MSEKDLMSLNEAIEKADADFKEQEEKRLEDDKQSEVAEDDKKPEEGEEKSEEAKSEDESDEIKTDDDVEKNKTEKTELSETNEDSEKDEDDIPDEEIQPLNQWDDKVLEEFNKLPKTAKKTMLNTFKGFQRGYGKKIEKLNEDKRIFEKSKQLGEDVSSILKPIGSQLKLRGVSETMLINQLVEVYKMLETDPKNGLKELAYMYQIDPTALAISESEKSPEIIRQEQDLRRKRLELSQREQQTLAVQEAANKISNFKAQRNDNGTLKYPDFDKVENQMAQIHKQTGETDLEKLYTSATNANPEILAQNLESKIAAEVEKRLKQQVEKMQKQSSVEKAKAASIDVKGEASSKNSEAHTVKKMTLDDAILDGFKE